MAPGDAVVVRLLGGRRSWDGFDATRDRCRAAGIPFVALSGEVEPDGELAAASTVPAGIVAEAHRYLAAGGPAQRGAAAPLPRRHDAAGRVRLRPARAAARHRGVGRRRPRRAGRERRPERPLVGVVFYRAHLVAGNTTFVADLCAAIDAAGGDALAVACYSLRPGRRRRVEALELLPPPGSTCW